MIVAEYFVSYLREKGTALEKRWFVSKTKSELFERFDSLLGDHKYELVIRKHTTIVEDIFPI